MNHIQTLIELSKTFKTDPNPHWETFYSILLERLEDITTTPEADLAMEQLATFLSKGDTC